jgi:hypothetical protein
MSFACSSRTPAGFDYPIGVLSSPLLKVLFHTFHAHGVPLSELFSWSKAEGFFRTFPCSFAVCFPTFLAEFKNPAKDKNCCFEALIPEPDSALKEVIKLLLKSLLLSQGLRL